MHPLKRHLKQRQIRAEDFAAQIGSTPSYVSQIICGYRHPSRELARQIEQVTGGAVTAAELLLWEHADAATIDPAGGAVTETPTPVDPAA